MALAGLDITAINSLAENLNSRLRGGLHGAFYEESSSLTANIRSDQLPSIFKLTELLETVVKIHEQERTAAMEREDDTHSRGTVRVNANSTRAIASVVDRLVGDRFRDISIELDRRRENDKKAAETIEAQATKIRALENEMKKLKSQDKSEKTSESKLKALQTDIARLSSSKATNVDLENLRQHVDTNCSLYAKESTLDSLRETMNSNVEVSNANNRKYDNRFEDLEKQVHEHGEAIKILRQSNGLLLTKVYGLQ